MDEPRLDLQKLYADDAVFTSTAKACAQELNSSELVQGRARAVA